MTRDIFDPSFGTLDVIVYAVLREFGLTRHNLSTQAILTPNEVAYLNAARYIKHFGDQRIAGIKAIRTVSGLGLKDAKDASDQIHETYADAPDVVEHAARLLDAGRVSECREYLRYFREAGAR